MDLVRLELIDIPAKRFRPVKKEVDEIAASMKQYGQLQPIILRKKPKDGRCELVDGLHRYTAAGIINWTSIWAVYTEYIDPFVLREIELEVNIRRVEMTWQEQQYAIAELHELKTIKDPTWTQRHTAEATNRVQSKVAEAIKFKQMAELFPEIAKAKSMRQAQSWMQLKARTVTRVLAVKEDPKYDDIESKIILGDSVEVIRSIPDESFHMVLTDPPFGIGYDTHKAGTNSSTTYEDSEESYERLLTMADDLYRVINKNGWLIWFLGISWYSRVKPIFREAGFIVDEVPIVWDRSEGHLYTMRPDRYFARGYDIALHCIKGSPEIILRGKSNIIRVPPVEEKEFFVERPVELYVELIRRLTLKGEKVADFFAGSGSVLAAAASLQRDFFGVELSAERRAKAITKVKTHLPRKE